MGRQVTNEEWIEKVKIKHKNKYDYSKSSYTKAVEYLKIICPIHGEFIQKAQDHLSGCGCRLCAGNNFKKTLEEFISEATKLHKSNYNYNRVIYNGNKNKVEILCNTCKQNFWQSPNDHLDSKTPHGCPHCNTFRKSGMEKRLYETLKINYNVIHQYRPIWLKVNKFLGMSLDFYLPDYNIGIEYQGRQHFKSIKYYGGDENLNKTKLRDEIKYELCKENGIELLYFSYDISYVPKDYLHKIFSDENDLINKINDRKIVHNRG